MSAGVIGFVGRLRAASGSDADLLRAYAIGRDADAFAALVRRHGGMVWATCRRVTGDVTLAEDAFQATFLVLARKAGGLTASPSLGGWLHAVAVNVSVRARTAADRRKRRETIGVEAAAPAPPELPDERALAALDEEVERLPAKLRDAVVLCELDGLSRREAAERLGVPEGTLSSRLAAARKRLAERLRGRGVGPEPLAVPAAAVPAGLAEAAAELGAGAVPAPAVAALVGGTMRAMLLKGLAVGAVVCGLLVVGGQAGEEPPAKPADPPKAASLPKGIWTTSPGSGDPPLAILTPDGRPTPLANWSSFDRVTHSPDGAWVAGITYLLVGNSVEPRVAVGRADDPRPPRLLPPLDDSNSGPPGPNPRPGVTGSPLHTDGSLGVHWDGAGPTLVIHAYETGTVRVTRHDPADGSCRPLPADTPDGPRSPDGRTVCLKVPVGPAVWPLRPHRLGLTPAGGGEAARLVSPFDREVWGLGRLFDEPRFSPDGRRLLYRDCEVDIGLKGRPDPYHERLVVLELATGRTTAVATTTVRPGVGDVFAGFAWSPDGRRVAYGRTRWRTPAGGTPKAAVAAGGVTVCDADGQNPVDIWAKPGTPVTVLDWR